MPVTLNRNLLVLLPERCLRNFVHDQGRHVQRGWGAPEAALGNREYFLNRPHGKGWTGKDRVP